MRRKGVETACREHLKCQSFGRNGSQVRFSDRSNEEWTDRSYIFKESSLWKRLCEEVRLRTRTPTNLFLAVVHQ